jgi:hypothetical protein
MSAVKQFIDRSIVEHLEGGFDNARQVLLEKSNKFASMVSIEINFSEDHIKNLTEPRERKVSEYVLHARKRIIDLYHVERNFHFDIEPRRKFKLLLLKERLSCKN